MSVGNLVVNIYLTIGRTMDIAMNATVTASTILETAQRMMQTVGYNGLSFRDIAAAVGIKSASVHYHFPSKGILGAAVMRRYTDDLVAALAELDQSGMAPQKALGVYVSGMRGTLEREGKLCLCAMLSAESDGIPVEVRAEVRRFIDLNVAWIAGTIARASGGGTSLTSPHDHAASLFAALQGAMLIARGAGDFSRFDAATAQFTQIGLLPR